MADDSSGKMWLVTLLGIALFWGVIIMVFCMLAECHGNLWLLMPG